MLRLANVATPLTAATVVVPANAPLPGLLPSATVTVPLKLGSVFPRASCAVTCTAGVMATAAVALLGCTVNTSRVVPPAVTVNPALVAPLTPVAGADEGRLGQACICLRFPDDSIPDAPAP